jgi:hypothetical protein
MKHLLIISAAIVLSIFKAWGQNTVPAEDAAKNMGKKVRICERVYDTKLESGSNTTLLYLGGDYPNQLLTVMIKGRDRDKFKGQPEIDFKGKDICVKGVVTDDKDKPEIVVTNPKQIETIMIDTPVKGSVN